MADEADKAAEQNAVFDEHIVKLSRQPEGPPPSGRCHNCDVLVPAGVRFCDRDCRDDWQDRRAKEIRRSL